MWIIQFFFDCDHFRFAIIQGTENEVKTFINGMIDMFEAKAIKNGWRITGLKYATTLTDQYSLTHLREFDEWQFTKDITPYIFGYLIAGEAVESGIDILAFPIDKLPNTNNPKTLWNLWEGTQNI